MTRYPIRVVKIGGSLFGIREFPELLRRWLNSQSPAAHILVAGGGKLADVIRTMDASHSLGDEPAHWMCIRLMSVTAQLVSRLLGDLPIVVTMADLRVLLTTAVDPPCVMFDVEQFLREEEPVCPGAALPRNWATTSDSIAARVAAVLGAELVLLKSADSPATTLADAGAQGYVDKNLATAASGLSAVRAVNLLRGAEADCWFRHHA